MANIKISDLTAAAAASGTQEFEVNDSLTSKKVTGAQVLAYVQANTTPASIGALATTAGAVTDTNLASNSVTTAKIADKNVTLAKLPDQATATILGRNSGSTGSPEVLTGAQARTIVGANDASNLTTGTVATARLGSGTANNTTFLRGDGTWATAGGTPTTAQVLSATAGLATGDVGSYGFLGPATATSAYSSPGGTYAGSGLRWSSGTTDQGGAPSGTWRLLGIASQYDGYGWNRRASLFVRIS